MHIGVDARVFAERYRTGVAEFSLAYLREECMNHPDNQYVLFVNAFEDIAERLPGFELPNVRYVVTRLPNKLLHACLWVCKRPYLDRVVGKKIGTPLDGWISLNPHVSVVSKKIHITQVIHDLSFVLQPAWYSWRRRIWHWCVNPKKQTLRADRVVTPSEHTRDDVVREWEVLSDKVQVVQPNFSFAVPGSNRYEQRKLQKKYSLPNQFILFLGTVEPRKNIDGLITAFDLWKKDHPEESKQVQLVIAGACGWKSWRVRRKIDKHPQIQYARYVDAADKMDLMAMARVFVYPSLYEGLGIPVLEACSVGTPVVTSNRSSLPEASQGNAYLADPNDIADIARGIHTQYIQSL